VQGKGHFAEVVQVFAFVAGLMLYGFAKFELGLTERIVGIDKNFNYSLKCL
jgi:hypothetical protein